MSCKLLNYSYYSKLSYLKRRKISSNILQIIPKRILSSSTNNDDNSSKKDLKKKKDLSKQKVIATDETEAQNDGQNLAKEKLMSLLTDFKLTGAIADSTKTNVSLTKPPQRLNRPKVPKDESEKKEEKFEDQIKTAVKNIVSTAAVEDPEKMEAELLDGASLASPELVSPLPDESTVVESSPPTVIIDNETEENLISAVKAVASTVVKDPEIEQSELTKKLLALTSERKSEIGALNMEKITGLFDGMKIEPTDFASKPKRAMEPSQEEISKVTRRRTLLPMRSDKDHVIKVDLFSASPMQIFKKPEEDAKHQKTFLWEKLSEKELKLMIHYAPTNAYEEMINLTEAGKHWKFPIDNEIDMGEEENVSFHEHVFLDDLLEGFPKKGPVRHFMQLVTTGLSKNPYITVERKKENVEWFRNYFEEKKDLLEGYLD